MPSGARCSHSVVEGGKRSGATDYPAIGRSPAAAVAIPRLDSIPSTLSRIPPEQVSTWAKIALLWLHAGEEMVEKQTVVETVQSTMQAWLKQHTIGFKNLADTVSMHAALDAQTLLFDEPAQYRDPGTWCVTFDVANHDKVFRLEEKATALEALQPGLGQAALNVLTTSGYASTTFMTPALARNIAEYVYWAGASTQEEWRHEVGSYHDDEEEIDELFSPDDFDAEYPEWVRDTKKPAGVPVYALAVDDSLPPEVQEVATILVEITALMEEGVHLSEPLHEAEQVYHGTYFRWSDEDSMQRLLDDYVQCANESGEGFTTLAGLEMVGLDQESFIAWKTRVEQAFRLMTLQDRLIDFLADQTAFN